MKKMLVFSLYIVLEKFSVCDICSFVNLMFMWLRYVIMQYSMMSGMMWCDMCV